MVEFVEGTDEGLNRVRCRRKMERRIPLVGAILLDVRHEPQEHFSQHRRARIPRERFDLGEERREPFGIGRQERFLDEPIAPFTFLAVPTLPPAGTPPLDAREEVEVATLDDPASPAGGVDETAVAVCDKGLCPFLYGYGECVERIGPSSNRLRSRTYEGLSDDGFVAINSPHQNDVDGVPLPRDSLHHGIRDKDEIAVCGELRP